MDIRLYQPKDKENCIQICYDTGYLGNSAAGHFSDKKLFGLLFCEYYLDYEPENCFVVDDQGQAVGYIIGTTDTLRYTKEFNKKMVQRILKRMLFSTLWKYNKDCLWILKEAFNASLGTEMNAIYREYPAHLHIDIWEQYRRKGLGFQMMDVFLEHLRKQGVRGIHLGTTNKNEQAVPFYQKYGFQIIHKKRNRFWGEDDLYSFTFALKL